MGNLLSGLLAVRNGALLLVLAASMTGVQSSCRSSSQTANLPATVNANNAANVEKSGAQMLELKLSSEKTRLIAGQCSDLILTVTNSSTRPILWKKDWIFEQEGPTPPLPESFPRSEIELAAGVATPVVSIRLCYADLAPGTYRYRISSSSKGSDQLRSNQLSIEVVP